GVELKCRRDALSPRAAEALLARFGHVLEELARAPRVAAIAPLGPGDRPAVLDGVRTEPGFEAVRDALAPRAPAPPHPAPPPPPPPPPRRPARGARSRSASSRGARAAWRATSPRAA